MRRRILAAILATVSLSLVLAGTGTYLLLRNQATQATESGLRSEAQGIAGLLTLEGNTRPGAIRKPRVVDGLRLRDISLLTVSSRGVLRGDIPEGLPAGSLDPQALLEGQTLSGRDGTVIWAAASEALSRGAVVAVLTRSPQRPAPPVGWFLVAGSMALAVAAAVATWLSGSLTRPLRLAQKATVRIAAGELTDPLPEPRPTARDEVAALTRSINAMAASLAHARGLERRFLLSVSHDLRTPLTSIRGYADAIVDGTAPDPVAAARIVGTEAQRLDRLVRDLLDLARLESSEFSLHLRTVDLAEVVADTAEGFRPAAESAGVAVHLASSALGDRTRTCGPAALGDQAVGTGCWSTVDPDRLAQAVANLIENALKYATANVWVELSMTDLVSGPQVAAGSTGSRPMADTGGPGRRLEPALSWLVTVTDDGPGIAPDGLTQVFDRLYVTGRQPARRAGGTGLGLAIVRELVAAMGGRTWAEASTDPSNHGTRLVIALPAVTDLEAGA